MTTSPSLWTLLPQDRVSKMNSLHESLREVLTTLPEWRQVHDKLAALGPAAGYRSAAADAEARMADVLDEVLTSGEQPDQATLLPRAAEIVADVEARRLLANAVEPLRQRLAAELDNAVLANTATLLRTLNERLQQLLTEAAKVFTTLGNVDSAKDAIGADVVAEWQTAEDLVRRHNRLRTWQRRLTELADQMLTNGGMPDPIGWIADPLAVDADYIARRLGRRIREDDGTDRLPTDPPWPTWPDNWRGMAALRWLAANPDARPWIPTADELADAEAELTATVREAGNADRSGNAMNRRRLSAMVHQGVSQGGVTA